MNKKTLQDFIDKIYTAAQLEDRKALSAHIREVYNIGYYDGQDEFQQVLEESISSFGNIDENNVLDEDNDDNEEDEEDDNLKWS